MARAGCRAAVVPEAFARFDEASVAAAFGAAGFRLAPVLDALVLEPAAFVSEALAAVGFGAAAAFLAAAGFAAAVFTLAALEDGVFAAAVGFGEACLAGCFAAAGFAVCLVLDDLAAAGLRAGDLFVAALSTAVLVDRAFAAVVRRAAGLAAAFVVRLFGAPPLVSSVILKTPNLFVSSQRCVSNIRRERGTKAH
ncbi:hypothetical protein [uncultured Roseibium sp.]|uniref:hypothetical protein n=1 Tax=uncultured Roseibium sp. TaxID=1936171 RepID=UPI0026318B7B|nr:hypothetical protein [uncultured Roseibium sp.]